MLNQDKLEQFITYAAEKFYFYVQEDFWSKPSMEEIGNWLQNFDTLEEQYCAAKLLDRFVYYSEADIIRLMEFGIYEKIIKRYILHQEKMNNFQLTNAEVQDRKKQIIDGMFFIPLSTGDLSESSLAMLRYLTIDLGFSKERILKLDGLKSEQLQESKNVVIIDDFIGSGKQISDFWSFKKVILDDEEISIFQLKEKFPQIDFEYFCLVCTEEGKSNFSTNYEVGIRTDLRITYGEMLGSKFKVFSDGSTFFKDEDKEACKNILQDLCVRKNIEFLGYQGLDYAIAFHHGIPDCSLPLFSTNSGTWNYLFRNKNTTSDEYF